MKLFMGVLCPQSVGAPAGIRNTHHGERRQQRFVVTHANLGDINGVSLRSDVTSQRKPTRGRDLAAGVRRHSENC